MFRVFLLLKREADIVAVYDQGTYTYDLDTELSAEETAVFEAKSG